MAGKSCRAIPVFRTLMRRACATGRRHLVCVIGQSLPVPRDDLLVELRAMSGMAENAASTVSETRLGEGGKRLTRTTTEKSDWHQS